LRSEKNGLLVFNKFVILLANKLQICKALLDTSCLSDFNINKIRDVAVFIKMACVLLTIKGALLKAEKHEIP